MSSEIRYNRLHRTWKNMKTRCFNENNVAYPNYGGRGITVCDEWLDYDNFYRDMVSEFSEGLELDRIDNDGPYSKENCRWVSRVVQANNKRNNVFLEYKNKLMTIPQWANELGIKASTISQRYHTYGWPVERCLSTKNYKYKSNKKLSCPL